MQHHPAANDPFQLGILGTTQLAASCAALEALPDVKDILGELNLDDVAADRILGGISPTHVTWTVLCDMLSRLPKHTPAPSFEDSSAWHQQSHQQTQTKMQTQKQK